MSFIWVLGLFPMIYVSFYLFDRIANKAATWYNIANLLSLVIGTIGAFYYWTVWLL